MKRKTRFAGSWYAGDPTTLLQHIKTHFLQGPKKDPREISPKQVSSLIGIVVPHAGHMYSGTVAAYAYLEAYQKATPQTVILIGPDHYGAASQPISIFNQGEWETPLGNLTIDYQLANKIIAELQVEADPQGHTFEHSLEIQLPFIKYCWPNTKILPIMLAEQTLSTSIKLGDVLGKTLNPEEHLLIATTDFSHYVPAELAREKDQKILELIPSKNPSQVYKTIAETKTTLCGYGPLTAIIRYSTFYPEAEIRLLYYANSGDVSGDYNQVVAYAAIAIENKTSL